MRACVMPKTPEILPDNHPKALDALTRAGRHLGNANVALEAGKKAKAERLYAKSGYWRDRFHKLTGRA